LCAANAATGGPPLVSAQQLSGVVGMPAVQGTLLADESWSNPQINRPDRFNNFMLPGLAKSVLVQ